MRTRDPERHLQPKHKGAESEGSAAIALSLRQIAPGQQRGGATDHHHDDRQHGNHDLFLRIGGLLRHPIRLGERFDALKVDQPAAQGCGFHAQRARFRGGPGHSGIGTRERHPLWVAGLECGLVQAGGREQRTPVHGGPGLLGGLELWRHPLKLEQPALGIQHQADHPRIGGRRVIHRDQARSQQIVMECDRGQRRPGLAIPEAQEGRLPGEDRVPAGRGGLLLEIVEEPAVPIDSEILVRRGDVGEAELADHVPRLLCQHLGGILGPKPFERARSGRQHTGRHQGGEHTKKQRHRDRKRQAFAFARRGHHLGRGGLASRQGGRQRIASGQCRRDGERGGGPACRLGLEASEDDALHHGVEFAHQAGRAYRRAFLLGFNESCQRGGFERQLAGEDLVEDQTQRIDVALESDFLAGQLFGRHVGRGAAAHVGTGDLAGDSSQAEIREEHLAAAIEHHVVGLQIAMEDALLMSRGEAGAQLTRDLLGFVGGEAPDAPQQGTEIFAIHVLHGEEEVAAGLAQVVHAAHVGMRNLPGRADLIAEAGEGVLIV